LIEAYHSSNYFATQACCIGGQEQREAFNCLKAYLTHMTKLTAPDPKDTLLLYISTSHSIVSTALVLEKEIEGVQR